MKEWIKEELFRQYGIWIKAVPDKAVDKLIGMLSGKN